jgi:hypothetical protein
VPGDVLQVVFQVAERQLQNPEGTRIQGEMLGGYQVTYAQPTSLGLTETEAEIMRGYRAQ